MTKTEREVVRADDELVAMLIPRISDLPQCEATRQHPYANDTATTNKRCKRKAKIVYRGTNMCLRHAEVAALNDALVASARHAKRGRK